MYIYSSYLQQIHFVERIYIGTIERLSNVHHWQFFNILTSAHTYTHQQMKYMCNHPVISQSKLFNNFLTLTEQKAWKMSKRQAEKDDVVGANFFKSISMPSNLPLSSNPEQALEHFKKFSKRKLHTNNFWFLLYFLDRTFFASWFNAFYHVWNVLLHLVKATGYWNKHENITKTQRK